VKVVIGWCLIEWFFCVVMLLVNSYVLGIEFICLYLFGM